MDSKTGRRPRCHSVGSFVGRGERRINAAAPDKNAVELAYIPKGRVAATLVVVPVTGNILAFDVDAGLRLGIAI